MTEIQITTTQNVNINFIAAEAGQRILAWFIDVIVKISYIGVLAFILTKLFGEFESTVKYFGDDMWSIIAMLIILFFPLVIYTLIQETLLGGQTIGKKLVKIKVVKIDGYQANFLDFFIRWIMRIVDVNMFYGIIGLVTIGNSKKNQRLGGIASGTAVITLKNKINIDHTILQEVEKNYQPTYLSVIKLSDNDVRIIKENFERAIKKEDHETLLIIKEKIIAVTGEAPHEDVSAANFIKRVIKDYNHFTQNM